MLCVKPIFWNPKMLVCTLGGEGYEKVYCLYFRNVQEMCTRDPKWLPHKTVPKTSFFIKITISQYHDIDISYIDIDIAKNAFSMTSLVVPLSIDPFQKAILSSSRCKLAILFSCQCWESNLDGIYQHIRFFPKAWFYQRVQVHVNILVWTWKWHQKYCINHWIPKCGSTWTPFWPWYVTPKCGV